MCVCLSACALSYKYVMETVNSLGGYNFVSLRLIDPLSRVAYNVY